MSARPKLLVTGATGLIGRQLAPTLDGAGFDVVTLGRHAPDWNIGAEHVGADLLDAQATARAVAGIGATHLLHLAWHGGGAGRWHDAANLDWAAATIMLVRAFASAGGRRMVAAGSCAEYDWSQGPVLGEDTPLRPASLYGKAKAATGNLLTGAAETLGLSVAWARIFFCYGPGEPGGRLMGDLLRGLSAGQPVPCTDGMQRRDYLHTADIARALLAVLASDLQGAVNIGAGRAVAVRDIIETTARLMGRPDLPQFGAIQRRPDDPQELVADTTRLDAIGFRPSLDLEAGIADCLRAIRTGRARA